MPDDREFSRLLGLVLPPAPSPPGDLRLAGPTVNASDRPGALATREIIAAAQAVEMPARGASVVRITSIHSTDDCARIIGFNIDGVAGTQSGPRYWGHSGLWPLEMAPIWETWRGYRFELLGRVQDRTAGPTGAPVAVIPWPSSTETIAVDLWRQRAFCDRSPAFAEILWRPQDLPHGTEQVLPPSGVRARQKKAAGRGFRLLRLLPIVGRPWEAVSSARRRLLTALLELKQADRVIDREALSGWTPGANTVDSVADLLDRAGWAMTPRTGRPVVKDIADKAHALRRRLGLSITVVVDLAERSRWDFDELVQLANKTHVERPGGT